MAKVNPVSLKEFPSLTSLGIAQNALSIQNVSISSDKYIAVREEAKGAVAIVDMRHKGAVERLAGNVESAIINPISKVIALRGGGMIQIFNLEIKSKMKETKMANVQFWKWVDAKTIALVTDQAVYHWSMDGNAEPVRMFARAESKTQVQFTNYSASADNKWLILGGVTPASDGVGGFLQVYSVDAGGSQNPLDAPAACFAHFKLDDRQEPSNFICIATRTSEGPRLSVVELGAPKASAFKQIVPISFGQGDFPLSMVADSSIGCLFIVTKNSVLMVFEIQSLKKVFEGQLGKAVTFAAAPHSEAGIVTVDSSGRVLHLQVDRNNLVPYLQAANEFELAITMAQRHNLAGAGGMFQQQFDRLLQANRVAEAVQLAVQAPQGVLRTQDTLNKLKNVQQQGGETWLWQYLSLLLRKGSLNKLESVELVRPIVMKKNTQALAHIAEWLNQSKLEPSEELGDVLKNVDIALALQVFILSQCSEKVIGCYLALGAKETATDKAQEQFKYILTYSKKFKYTPEYVTLVMQLLRVNRDRARDFALLLMRGEDGTPLVDVNVLVDLFSRAGDVPNTTAILFEYLKTRGDRPEDAALQTRLLEMCLLGNAPQLAASFLDSEDFKLTHFDHLKIAQLCERNQLYQQALDLYRKQDSPVDDIKRVLTSPHRIPPDYIVNFFGKIKPAEGLEVMRGLLKANAAVNIRIVVEIAKKWSDHYTPKALIELFDEFKSWHGLYFYLNASVNFAEDKNVVFKYIQAAVELKQMREVERVCRDLDNYDPKQVKQYLLDANLKDPRPLIHVCDRFGFVDELTEFLYKGNQFQFIQAYVQIMNPKATPKVVGSLIELNCPDDQIKALISSIRPPADAEHFVEHLVAEVEARQRLPLLQKWLEARAGENVEDPHLHNALAKIYVDINMNAAQFLTTNRFYDSKVVGKYCETKDPHLSFIAYKRAWGPCDKELIAVTNAHGFFKDQAKYLVERQDLELWKFVLEGDQNKAHRRNLIDQVVATALPESKVTDEVVTAVKAFMAAELPNELIELLERIILHSPADSEFRTHNNLQNLLILTAIKADKKRVMDYINRLEHYSGPDIATIAKSDAYKLYEEAFFIYKKFKKNVDAIRVLIDKFENLDRAQEFAEYCSQPEVWTVLGRAQLDSTHVKQSIDSFLKAADPTHFADVITAAKRADLHAELITFLTMARSKIKSSQIDNEIIFSLAKINKTGDLENFIISPHSAKLEECGDQCFQQELYEAARILFAHVNNNGKLALCYVHLGQFVEAVEAARKANNVNIWKQVCFACVDHKEFRLAQQCGAFIIVNNEHLADLIRHYERNCYFDEIIAVLEGGLNLERAHHGIFTHLGILYCKYKEDRTMEHIKMHWQRINIPTLLQACKDNEHWPEVVFLFSHYDQYENAMDTMVVHSSTCWTHEIFKDVLSKVANSEVYFKAIRFYLSEHPLLLNDLLMHMGDKLDHSRVVHLLRENKQLPLAHKYLLNIQRHNLQAVNDAVNELAFEDEDYKALRTSLDLYDKFDQIALAQKLETYELVEFRRLAAYLYKMQKRWERSMEISRGDNLWQDAMETAAASKEPQLAENLLRSFVEKGQKECFAACLFTCYELIRPDVVLELAWRHNLMDSCMPFMIQTFFEYDEKLSKLSTKLQHQEKITNEQKEKQEKAHEETADAIAAYNLQAPLGLPSAPTQMGMGMGMPPMGMGMGMPPMGMGMPPYGAGPYYPQGP